MPADTASPPSRCRLEVPVGVSSDSWVIGLRPQQGRSEARVNEGGQRWAQGDKEETGLRHDFCPKTNIYETNSHVAAGRGGGCSLGAAPSAILVSWWPVLRPSGWRPRNHPSSRPSELCVRSVGAAGRVQSLAGSAGPACAGGKEPSEALWGHMRCPGPV